MGLMYSYTRQQTSYAQKSHVSPDHFVKFNRLKKKYTEFWSSLKLPRLFGEESWVHVPSKANVAQEVAQ